MNMVRGITLWLAPAVLASFICTLAWHLMLGGGISDLRFAFAIMLATLMFTIGGSGILILLFARMRPTPVVLRYIALVAFGCGAGAFAMFWTSSEFRVAGSIYGVVTACLWCVVHMLLYPSEAPSLGKAALRRN